VQCFVVEYKRVPIVIFLYRAYRSPQRSKNVIGIGDKREIFQGLLELGCY